MSGALRWNSIQSFEVAPGIVRRVGHGQGVTLIRLSLMAGARLPRHSHEHEQVVHVIAGRLRLSLFPPEGDHVEELGPGDAFAIPPDLAHEALAVEDVESLEVFTPRRDELEASPPL